MSGGGQTNTPASVSSSLAADAPLQIVELTIRWMEWEGLEATASQNAIHEINCTSQDYPDYLKCSNPDCQATGFPIGPFVAKMLTQGIVCATDSVLCWDQEAIRQGCGHWINFVIQVEATT